MTRLRIGQVDYIDYLPVYHALEDGLLVEDLELVKGTPVALNKMFFKGELDIAPISSIEYARNSDQCVILPDLSVSTDGKAGNILLFSRLPVVEMEGKRVCVTTSSATAVALLRILFEHYYHVEAEIIPGEPNLGAMLASSDGALLIGDEAMKARRKLMREKQDLVITDLGEAWKDFSGEKIVYTVWVAHAELAEAIPEIVNRVDSLLTESLAVGLNERKALAEKAHRRTKLPRGMINDYLEIVQYDLGEESRRALTTLFDYAYKSGLTDERIKLNIWGE